MPRFYLEGFVDPKNEPFVWIYEKGNEQITKATVEDIAVRNDYYSFTTEAGEKDSDTFEEAFADLESKAAPVLKKLKNTERLKDEERSLFSYFIAYSMTRVPNYRDFIEQAAESVIKKAMQMVLSDRTRVAAILESVEKKDKAQRAEKIEELAGFVEGEDFSIKVGPEFSLGMVGLAKELAPVFYKMHWAFLRSTEEYKFVTSDNPVYYYDPTKKVRSFDGVGLMNPGTEVLFPLSRDLTLLCSWNEKKGYYQINSHAIRIINKKTVIHASRFVFSSERSKGISIIIKEYKDSSVKPVRKK